MEPTRTMPIIKIAGESQQRVDDALVQERRVTLSMGGERLLDVACSPGSLRELVYGHLLAVGRIGACEDVATIAVSETDIDVRLAGAKPTVQAEPDVTRNALSVSKDQMIEVVRSAESLGTLFRKTGGTHLAAVVPCGSKPVVVEDISRTCALEKALGAAMLRNVAFERSILVVTSRVPMSFVRVAARAGIPILGAVSAPTYQAVEEADRLGICLCGFVRGVRLNVYSQPWRVDLT